MENFRFIKSQWAKQWCDIVGMETIPAEKFDYECCPGCGQPIARSIGWIVDIGQSARSFEKEFGVKTSSSRWTYRIEDPVLTRIERKFWA